MGRREKLEARADRREQWAQGAESKSEQAFSRSRAATEGIPFGQPVLVGHHSESRHRRDIARGLNGLQKGVELAEKAQHHERRAAGLRRQLDNSIFSDDENAIEALEAKAAKQDEAANLCNEYNRTWRKGGVELMREKYGDKIAAETAKTAASYSWLATKPFCATSYRAEARRCRQRIEEIKRRNKQREEAQDAGGMTVSGTGDYVHIAFADKPEWDILKDLKETGFRWSGGSWFGSRENIPDSVADLATEQAHQQDTLAS